MFSQKFWKFFNVQALFQTLLLTFFFVFLSFLVWTKRYLFYIHPRYEWILWLSLPLLALGIFQSVQAMKRKVFYQGKKTLYAFALPFLLVLLSLDMPQFSQIGLKPYRENVITQVSGIENLENTNSSGALVISNDPVERLPSVSGSIKIDTSDYAAWLSEVLSQPDAYVGKNFTFLGRINESPYAEKGQALLGRPVMLCCAADSQNLGFFASLPSELKSSQGHWYYFTVKVQKKEQSENQTAEPKVYVDIVSYTRAGQPASVFAFYFGTKAINTEVEP